MPENEPIESKEATMVSRSCFKSATLPLMVAIGLLACGFYYLIGGEQAHEIVNAIVCATSLGVAVSFTSDLCRALAKHPWEWQSDDAMMVGIFTLGVSLCVVFVGLWGYRLSDNDIWWKTNPIFFTARVFAVLGFALMMTAARSVKGDLPREAYLKVGWIIAGAIAFALLMISLGYS